MSLRLRDDALSEVVGFRRISDEVAAALSPYPIHSASAVKREGEIACGRPVKSGLMDHKIALESILLNEKGGTPLLAGLRWWSR